MVFALVAVALLDRRETSVFTRVAWVTAVALVVYALAKAIG